MSEHAAPLVATGSITPGRSIAAMFEIVAGGKEVAVDNRLSQAWGAVNNLYTHIDNRLDLDHPGSKPEGSPDRLDVGAWRPWFDYLVSHSVDLPQAGDLTLVQRRAFAEMRDSFVQLGLPTEQRMKFVTNMQLFMDASWKTKQATDIQGGTDNFDYWRKREALAIAHLFTSIVPEDARRSWFDRFERNAEHGVRAFKMLDSAMDMGRDSRNGNINLQPTMQNRLRLLGRVAMPGVRAALGVHLDPRVLWRGGLKMVTMFRNRSGKLNDQRTNK